jgi:lipoprotein-releasing system permease protein
MDVSKFIAARSFASFRKSNTKSIIRLSILATSLSLAVMIISQSILNGFQKEIANKVFGFWGHIHVTDIQTTRSIEPFMIKLSDSLKQEIANMKIPGETETPIRHLQTFLIFPTIAASKSEFEGLFLKGVGEDFDWHFFSSFLLRGRIIQKSDSLTREILLSEQTANRLSVDTGESLILNFIVDEAPVKRKIKVVGIYNTGLGEYDKKFALLDINFLQQLLNKQPDEVTGIEIFCKDILKADQINDYLHEEFLPSNWISETIRLKHPAIFEWLSLQSLTRNFILLLILAVCIINMSTTTMILIFERTHMIGVLTVLGMKRWFQQKIFIRYAAKILLSSMIIGNIFGFGLILLQKQFKLIKLHESDYYLSYAPVDLSILPILILNILFFTCILLFLLLPTIIVQSIQPVNAVKFR